MMIVIITIFHLLASLMRKGAVSTATFPSTDFCLVNGGPIVAFPSSYMPVARFFLFLYAFCLCKCSVYGYIMNKAPIFPALIFAYLLSLYWKCGRKFWQTVPGRWTYWRFVEMKLPIWDGSHFFVLLDEFNWKSTADHTIFLQFSLQLTAKRIPSEAKPLLKCAKREPHLSFWLLRLLFILFLIPPPVFTSLWLRRVGVGRHQMPHCLFCLFVCFWFGWSFLFGCFGCSPIVHWEGFLDRTCTNTLFLLKFVCLSVSPREPVHMLTIERLGLDWERRRGPAPAPSHPAPPITPVSYYPPILSY